MCDDVTDLIAVNVLKIFLLLNFDRLKSEVAFEAQAAAIISRPCVGPRLSTFPNSLQTKCALNYVLHYDRRGRNFYNEAVVIIANLICDVIAGSPCTRSILILWVPCIPRANMPVACI